MSTTNDRHNDDDTCDDSEPVWPILLATGSALFLGYLVGRVSFAKEVRQAIRRIEESPEPIEVSVRVL